ncbi:MAG: CheR family methyltransferase [Candidatus Omnitrophota bacterium]
MTITAEIRDRIKNFVESRGGLYFRDHDLRSLEDGVRARISCCGFNSASVYYNYLTTSQSRENELRELLNLLTINHSYFFRNKAHFKVLKEKILPKIIEKKLEQSDKLHEKPTIRIWSSGCSSGEEPYSIAIVIREAIPNWQDWRIFILATDASEEALARAREGTYTKNAIKSVDNHYLKKYFSEKNTTEGSKQYVISDTIKRMVNFAFLNLMDEEYPGGFDIIFCRNVVIYFALQTTVRVMNRLHASLLDDGYLFIGYSETLQFLGDKFEMLYWEDALYYRKRLPTPTKAEPGKIDIDKALEEISKAELSAEKARSPKIEEILVQIIKAIYAKEYDKALNLIEQALAVDDKAADLYYHAAEIFVNQAKFDKARERLSTVLKLNSLFTPAYYLLGFMYLGENEFDKAKENLRKALYIERDFLIAHFYLAQIFRNEGNIKEAIRGYRNTISLLLRCASTDIIAYSGGYNVATLMSVCRDNLERIKLEQ